MVMIPALENLLLLQAAVPLVMHILKAPMLLLGFFINQQL
jgi:hypothetical protein